MITSDGFLDWAERLPGPADNLTLVGHTDILTVCHTKTPQGSARPIRSIGNVVALTLNGERGGRPRSDDTERHIPNMSSAKPLSCWRTVFRRAQQLTGLRSRSVALSKKASSFGQRCVASVVATLTSKLHTTITTSPLRYDGSVAPATAWRTTGIRRGVR